MARGPAILLTNENRGWGGAEIHTLALAQAYADRRLKAVIVAQPDSELAERAQAKGLLVEPVRMRNEVDLLAVARLLGLMFRHRVGIVHAHATRDHILASFAAALAGRIPVVKTEHTFLEHTASGLCRRTYAARTWRIVAVSEAIRRHLAGEYGIADRVDVIYNGIDPARYAPLPDSPPGPEGQTPAVGVVGSLIPVKGHRYFLEAAAAVLKQRPDTLFIVVGAGPLNAELKEKAAHLGIASRVIFAGYQEDVRPILGGLRVVAVPSLEEACPTVVLEAMAMAKPVVAFRVGGIPELLAEGESGLLVDPKDSEALAGGVLALLRDPDRARRMGDAARARLTANFTLEVLVTRTLALYQAGGWSPS